MTRIAEERIRKVIIGIIVFFGLAVAGAGIALVSLLVSTQSRNVEMTLTIPAEVVRGVPFNADVALTNGQEAALSNAIINLEIPRGVAFLGVRDTRENAIVERVGEVGAGSIVKRSFALVATDSTGAKETIRAIVRYANGSRSQYRVEDAKEVRVARDAIAVHTVMPDQVLRGSTFEFEVNYQNESSFPFPDLVIKASYPDTFHFESASFPPDEGQNLWRLGALRAGSKGRLIIKGTYEGKSEEPLRIPLAVYAHYANQDYAIAESSSSAALAPSPVGLSIAVNNQEGYVARAGDTLAFTIHYENRSGVALDNASLTASLSGEMLDLTSLKTDARAGTGNALVWDAANVPAFHLLDAGASGDVSVTARLKREFPIARVGNKNYAVKMFVEFSSPTAPYYMKAGKIVAAARSETKIAGLMTLDAKLLFRDVDVVNFGPFPPKVGVPTEYAVHWRVRNFSTDVGNAMVRVPLSAGVEFVSVERSSTNIAPMYNSEANEVVWNLGKLMATKGVVGDPLEAIFKVRATPRVADTQQFMSILGEAVLSATDDFTGRELEARARSFSTALPDDPTVGQDGGRVMP